MLITYSESIIESNSTDILSWNLYNVEMLHLCLSYYIVYCFSVQSLTQQIFSKSDNWLIKLALWSHWQI